MEINKEDKPIESLNNCNDREFQEVEGGFYTEQDFYVTPNGSFWDPDGIYFNRDGYDKHEGYYDEEFEYHPGRGWIPHMLCYEDDLPDKQEDELEDEGLDYDNCDDLHEELDYMKLTENKDKSECIIKKNVLVFTGDKKPKINEEVKIDMSEKVEDIENIKEEQETSK